MKIFETRIFHLVLGVSLGMPSASFAAPVTPASQPLFMEGTVKHNLILAIDDSGSMDFETLVNANDGAFWLGENGSFLTQDGRFNDPSQDGVRSQNDGGKYTYVLPNGENGTYDGRKLGGNHYSIPPIKPFAYARSSEFNKAYYDPNVEYNPWPSYGGFVFNDVNPAAAPLDIMRDTQGALDLTSDLNTSGKGDEWGFEINDADMPCTDDGGRCGTTGTEHYTYFPAHYYRVKTSGTYTFTAKTGFPESTSILFEAEDATLNYTGFVRASASDSDVANEALIGTASAADYIGVGEVATSGEEPMNAPPSAPTLELEYTFTPKQVGAHIIWVRRRMADGNSDSLWMSLENFGRSDISVENSADANWYSLDGQDWHKWWEGHEHSTDWYWEPWGRVEFVDSSTSQTLEIRYRESDVYIDQILITPEDSVPNGPEQLVSSYEQSVTRDCATDPVPAHYQQFFEDTTQFSGVDAIGPGGECLERVDIDPSQTSYTYEDSDGVQQTRTYDDEIVNFANWFTYYRRRHQAMRGGLGSALQGIGGIRAGLFWINNRRDVSMYDLDTATDLNAFLSEHYDHVNSGGTPNRLALNHAGEQFMRTGDDVPVQYECQKNFTLLFTDGFSTLDSPSAIGNEDGDAGAPYADTYSGTLADIAHYYYETNLRPNLDTGEVRLPAGCNQPDPSPWLDCNADLHMNTYAVGLGASGEVFGVTHQSVIDAYSDLDTDGAIDYPVWPDTTNQRDKRMVDDLYHAAVNGRGEMFNALTPADLSRQLTSALRDIIESIGNSSSVTFNTGTLSEESLVYSASFNSTAWSGDLEARELDPSSGDVSETPVWKAADVLDGQSPTNRTIITYSNNTNDGIPFRWNTTNLDSGQIEDLSRSPTGTQDSLGAQRLAFIRGSRAGEGNTFRNRSHVLGDIVNSTPVYVGKPKLAWPDAEGFGTEENRYSKFRNITAADRTPVIYVGANDGMIHGFKAVENPADGGGEEVLAYIPRSVYSSNDKRGLNYLTRPDYNHQYYVDLSPQAADVYIKTTPSGAEDWRTVLIGGLRNGGVGLFALDVTDPDQFSESNASDIVLWEFTEDDDPRLNYTLSEPTVVKMNNGRWAMVLGNGPANGATADDESTGLFIIYMDGGLDGDWDDSGDYEYIELSATSGGMSMVQPVDLNGDRIVDRIYGGDREGNLWVVDVTDSSASKWMSAYSGKGQDKGPKPMFTAMDDDGNPQPVMTRPLVVRNIESPPGSEGNNGEDYLIFFGTGRYFADGDSADTSPQAFYGVWDRGEFGLNRSDDLVEQTISTISQGGKTLRQSGDATIDWEGSTGDRDYGWYMDLPELGERVINSAQIRGQTVFFETFTPSNDPCSGGGSGWLMSVALDGTNPDEPVFDVNNDGVINSEDVDDNGTAYIGEKNENMGTGGTAFLDDFQYLNEVVPVKREVNIGSSGQRTGRLGWQEIIAR